MLKFLFYHREWRKTQEMKNIAGKLQNFNQPVVIRKSQAFLITGLHLEKAVCPHTSHMN